MYGQARKDDDTQRDRRDRILRPLFYDRFYPSQYRFLSVEESRRFGGADTLVRGEIRIDEKIMNHGPNVYFSLEVRSCTVPGRETPGWMVTLRVDFLLYCFADDDDEALTCYLIDFPALQKWFAAQDEARWKLRRMEGDDHPNHTECRLVPVEEVCRSVKVKKYYLSVRKKKAREPPPGNPFFGFCHCGAPGLYTNQPGWTCNEHRRI